MSEQFKDAGGVNPSAGGAKDDESKKKDETISYETYQRVLDQKKKRDEELEVAKAKLSELAKAEKARQEAELKEKEDFKTLLSLREQELKKRDEELQSLKGNLEAGAKLRAFLDTVNGVVDKQYWTLVELDEIKIDPNSGLPDQISVESLARKFEQEYGLVLKQKGAPRMLPNQAAQGAGGKITVAEWKALKSSKEMKEKMHLVDWSATPQ